MLNFVNARARPTPMKIEPVVLQEDEPLVLHLPRSQAEGYPLVFFE